MAIVIKAKKGDSTGNLIRRFKKAVMAQDLVNKARDRRYYKKPATIRAEKKSTKKHLRKKLKSLKKRKNITQRALEILKQKIRDL